MKIRYFRLIILPTPKNHKASGYCYYPGCPEIIIKINKDKAKQQSTGHAACRFNSIDFPGHLLFACLQHFFCQTGKQKSGEYTKWQEQNEGNHKFGCQSGFNTGLKKEIPG